MEETDKFQEELSFCIDFLESSLRSGKLSEKQAKDASKALKSLRNGKNPLPKKRQIMSISCGDYRAKMANLDKSLDTKDASVVAKKRGHEKSIFLKKHCMNEATKKKCAKVEESGFKFNFDIINLETGEESLAEVEKEEKFKFVKSDNSFRFNF